MKLISFLILSCLTFAQEVRFQKDGDTTNVYNTGLTTPAEIVAGRKNIDSLFLSQARFKDNVTFDSTVTFRNGVIGLSWVTVEQYGAVGDGVTDDFLAIQTAVDSSAGRTVIIGQTLSDVYRISQPVYLISNTKLLINGIVKIMNGDSSALTIDSGVGDSIFTVADGSKFAVGQWVAVSDTQTVGTAYIYIRAAWRGAGGRIASINGNIITLEETVHPCASCPDKIFTVTKKAMLSHCQNVFLAENIENIEIYGSGIIDANKANQKQIWMFDQDGSEQMRVGCALTLWDVDNVIIDGITFKNGLLHNIAINSDETTDSLNQNIRLNNVTALYGHDKNINVRYTNNIWVTNTRCDSATWEDGLIFYSYVTNAYVSNFTANVNNRYGLAWNSNYDQYLTADNIKTTGNVDRGVFIASKNANLSNIISTDPFAVSSAYTCKDINLTNVTVQGVAGGDGLTSSAVFTIGQSVERVNINNLVIENCSGTGLYISNASGVDQKIKIIGGGIYNHSGIKTNITANADVLLTNFEGIENLVSNGDMELNEDWFAGGTEAGDTVQQNSAKSYNGTYSWYASVDASNEGIYSQDLNVVVGNVYKLVMWIYPLDTAGGIRMWDVYHRLGLNDTLTTLTPSSWNKVVVNVTADSTGIERLYFTSNVIARTRFYIDDVKLISAYSKGTAVINSGADSVIVYHNLYRAPIAEEIAVTAQQDMGGKYFWVNDADITDTYFIIRLSAAAGANYTLSWLLRKL